MGCLRVVVKHEVDDAPARGGLAVSSLEQPTARREAGGRGPHVKPAATAESPTYGKQEMIGVSRGKAAVSVRKCAETTANWRARLAVAPLAMR